MKKLLLIILVASFASIINAKQVNLSLAQQVAQNFINTTSKKTGVHSTNATHKLKCVAKRVTDNQPYYIFNNEDGGFVIVSGDDCATPILGYSNEGNIDINNLPIQLEYLLQAYALEIQEAINNNLQATDSISVLWDSYKKTPQSQNTITAVEALLSTSWNQYPRYNDKCPVDPSLSSLGNHPTTGCVATAMAQIMKYWEYPTNGKGNKSYKSQYYGTLSANFANTMYDWKNMPLKLTASTSTTQNNAVAILMYHCGVAVEMNYNSDGNGSSGAYVVDLGNGRASAEKALETYFGYASTIIGKKWGKSTSTATWKNMLKTELDNRRPILYAGYSPNGGGGHAFVCDGYDSLDKFHFNWGWGGSANGFFSLTALTPSSSNYTENQQAVIGIKPADGSEPAKNYLLQMNTDLIATNTSNTGSSMDVNPYNYGNTISFNAKVENNGTGSFYGTFRVAAFTDEGEFVAWSKESHHFSLGAGKVTEKQTFTFDGGHPFIPGRYRAYLYYKDDDKTEWQYVQTDDGIIFTEYNNVAFTIKISSGDLVPTSTFNPDDMYGTFVSGSKLRIYVDIKNTALFSTFYGKIRLNLYNTDGTLAQVIEERDFTSDGFPSLTTYNLNFFNYIEVEPGTYYMALVYQKKGEMPWYYMRSIDSYPNPVKVIIKAQSLYADNYEINNTQSTATMLKWEIDKEIQDFGTSQVSLHEDTDIDYYKLSFQNIGKYEVRVSLYDKYNNSGMWYENADAQFAYSVGGNTYSDYYKNEQVVVFNGPTVLYIRVMPYAMNGLGYYELAGEVKELEVRNDCKSVPYTETFASSQGDFTVYNALLPSGFTSIWNWSSQYGMVAKCIKGSTKYASEAYLISPCIELPENEKCVLTFSHAAKFFQDTKQMSLWISTNYDETNPEVGDWERLVIPTYPTGDNWNWFESGAIDLSKYSGQNVNIAFCYTSTESYAPQWEIKNFAVKKVTTNELGNIEIDCPNTTKILRNGQILIIRDGKTYNVMGQEL